MTARPFLTVLALAALASCATNDRVQKLEARLDAIEKKQEEAASRGPRGAEPAGDPAKEEEAKKILQELHASLTDGKIEEAKAGCDRIRKDYADTKTGSRGAKSCAEVDVWGKPGPTQLNVEKWFQGQEKVDVASNKTTLYVFWEVWCPHCKREVPELQKTWESYGPKGLQVVGLTKLTRNKTEADVETFLKENKVTYPIAKEKGDLSEYFAVTGIPAAAVVKDGKVVWRGHPGQLSEDKLKGWLGIAG